MAELRSFIFIDQLQPQTMCYLGTWIRGRLPRMGMAAQVIEVAPGLDIEPLTDVALKHTEVQAGMLVVERQFGYLEFHVALDGGRAGRRARRCSTRSAPRRRTRPSRRCSPRSSSRASTTSTPSSSTATSSARWRCRGESLFVLEMQPASYAILATNEAEKAADIKVVDYRMIGATGRVYLTGERVRRARGLRGGDRGAGAGRMSDAAPRDPARAAGRGAGRARTATA